MNRKVDYKKDFKHLYLPKPKPEIVDVPRMPFFMIDGSGDPNGETFVQEVEALYSLSYAVRMSYKNDEVPEGYYEYTVFPLEGVWDLVDRSKPATDKSNLKYTIMIRQPDFLTDAWFKRFLEKTMQKKKEPLPPARSFRNDGRRFELPNAAYRQFRRRAGKLCPDGSVLHRTGLCPNQQNSPGDLFGGSPQDGAVKAENRLAVSRRESRTVNMKKVLLKDEESSRTLHRHSDRFQCDLGLVVC